MITEEAIQKIMDLGYKVEEIEGCAFHVSPAGATLLKYPTTPSMKSFSLDNLINFIKTDPLGDDEKLVVNIVSHQDVQVESEGLNPNKARDLAAEASMKNIYGQDFPFGRQMKQEEFIINVMTKFVQDAETVKLLKLVSSISQREAKVSDDDGYSQTATVKSGVALVSELKVQNLWKLKTYKTFPEVEQPIIPYVLRLHGGVGDPQFALYDCDGGSWKIEAVKNVRNYLAAKLKEQLPDGLYERVTVL